MNKIVNYVSTGYRKGFDKKKVGSLTLIIVLVSYCTILVNVNNSLLRLGDPADFLCAAVRINYS